VHFGSLCKEGLFICFKLNKNEILRREKHYHSQIIASPKNIIKHKEFKLFENNISKKKFKNKRKQRISRNIQKGEPKFKK